MVKVAPADPEQAPLQEKPYGRLSSGSSWAVNSEGTARTSGGRMSSTNCRGVTSSATGGSGEVAPFGITHYIRRVMRNFLLEAGWYESATAIGMRRFLHGKKFAMIIILALFVALFLGEVFTLLQVPTNAELDVILTLVLLIFIVEFISLSLVDASYFLGFFFWMDLIGTVSMVADISYFGLATKSSQVKQQDTLVTRLAKTAKIGARAGRLSRFVKIFSYFTSKADEDAKRLKMAKVISNQLSNVLSTRIALFTICVVIVLPFLNLPAQQTDSSLGGWKLILDSAARIYHEALSSGNATLRELTYNQLRAEVQRCSDFFGGDDPQLYGVFRVCLTNTVGLSEKEEVPCVKEIPFDTSFSLPSRNQSIREVRGTYVQALFDYSGQDMLEAAFNIGLLVFIIAIMLGFGLVMTHKISVIALRPLERMLSVVRERCAQIFKYTDELRDSEDSNDENEEEKYDDCEHSSEFALLERVVSKLAAIAHLSATNQEPEVKYGMDENELLVLNWTQGGQVAATAPGKTHGNSIIADDSQGTKEKEHLVVRFALPSLPLNVIESIDTAHFNALDLSKEHKIAMGTYLVLTSEGCAQWVQSNVQEQKLVKFVTVIESNYAANPFHNFSHGIDVTYSVYRFMKLISAHRFLAETSQFWILIAAIAHDVGHFGLNNQYLVEASHELAVKYNDRSPLENLHCSMLFQCMTDAEANIFSQVDKELYKEMRKGMIICILHTDISKHNAMIKELGMLYQMNSEAFDALTPEEPLEGSQNSVQTCLNALLHGADVANPMKPWVLCERIAHLCLDEFFAQGDLEKATGIPVQMLNDREKVNRPNSQIGFIEFLIVPFAEVMVNMFPQLDSLANDLAINIVKWSEVWQEEVSPPPEAVAKVQARTSKVVGRCKAVTRLDRGIPVGS